MSDTGQKLDLTNYDKMKAAMSANPAAATDDPAAPVAAPPQGTAPALAPEAAAEGGDGSIPTALGQSGAPKGGLIKMVTDTFSGLRDTLTGAAAGAARIPGTLAGGVMDFASDAIPHAALRSWGSGLLGVPEVFPGQHAIGALSMVAGSGLDKKGMSYENIASSKDYLGKIGNTSVNQGVATIGSLVLGSEGVDALKIFRFLPKAAIEEGALAKLGKSAFNFGTASGVLLDPNAQRLTSSLNNLGIHSEFTDWLGADPDQASAMENRFKNAVEGATGGVLADSVFLGAKYLRTVLKGTPDAALQQTAIDAAKQVIPEAAQPATSEVAAVRGAGTMEVRVDGQPSLTMPSEQYNSLLEDVKTFKATPGSIAAEHAAEVSSLEAAGTAAARKSTLLDSIPEGISKPKPSASPLDSVPESISKAPTGILIGMDNEAVAPLLRSLAIKLHDTPHEVRPDAVRNAMAEDAAREVGVDPSDMLAYAANVAGDVADIDVSITATQMLWRRMASDMDTISGKPLTEAASESEIAAAKTAINNIQSFTGSFQDIRSSMGRGLRSTAIFRRAVDYVGDKLGVDSASTKLFKETNMVPPQPNTLQDVNDFFSIWKDLKGDPEARMNFLRSTHTIPSQWKYLRTSFANNFTANALAGLPSLSMNIFGPTVIGVQHTLEKTTGGFFNALNPLLSAEERAANLSVASNAARAYIHTVADIPDAFRFAAQAVRENKSILGGGPSIDAGRMGPVTDAMIRAAGMKDGPTLGYQLGNLINWWPRNFQRINAGLDEFAKRLSYMGEVRLNAMVEHDTQTGGASPNPGSNGGPALMSKAEYVKAAMENSIDEVGEATDEAALRSAERTTLTGQLSGNPHQEIVGRAASLVQAVRSQFPESRYIVPVFNVPANALGETMRRIPGVNYLMGETRAELAGELGPVRQADAYGRTMLGAAFLLWAMHASRNGQLTGSGPTDLANRKGWSDQGYQPYSVRLGDKWVDYSRYDLPGATLGIAANLYDSTVYHSQQDPGYEARVVGSIGALAQYFKDKAALQGISSMMNFGANPNTDETFLNRTLNSTVTRSLVPNFVTQLGRNTTDDTKRSATSVSEALMNSLPMASRELDPTRNVLGEPLHVPRDSLLENILPVTIAPATTFKSDPVMSELDRLRQATGDAPGVTHHSRFDGGFYDSTQVKLENGRSLYDAVIGARMTVVNPATGQNLRAALADTFKMDEYKNARDASAEFLQDSEGNVSRGAVIAKIFEAYNKASIQAVAKESPIARHMLAITAAKQRDNGKLSGYSADDLVKAPEIFKALNIPIDKYEEKVSGQ
jgi:hypothetical protein